MNPSESFGFAEATASGNDLSLSTPFTNNAEIILDSSGVDFSGAGVATANPVLEGGQTASASEGQPGALATSGAYASPAAASGHSMLIYGVLSLVVIAAIVHFHHK
jgi:hypothetical protein